MPEPSIPDITDNERLQAQADHMAQERGDPLKPKARLSY
jgi:hypothetical protein